MNHPYLYPDEAPWTDDYAELRSLRKRHHSYDDDDYDYPDSTGFLLDTPTPQRQSTSS